MINSKINQPNREFENLTLYPKKIPLKTNKFISAVFLDRDGVIIEDCHYTKNPDDVKLCPGAKNLLRELNDKNIIVVVITNQSGIKKNFLSWEDYREVNNRMIKLLGYPNPINAIYANSYISDQPITNWRKPNPTMIFKAALDLNLNLKKSILIGDRITDIIAGQRANIPKIFHVLTGHGKKERGEILKFISQKKISNESKVFCKKDLEEVKKDLII